MSKQTSDFKPCSGSGALRMTLVRIAACGCCAQGSSTLTGFETAL